MSIKNAECDLVAILRGLILYMGDLIWWQQHCLDPTSVRGFALVSSVLETPVTVIPMLWLDTKAVLFPGNCSPCTAAFSKPSHSPCLDECLDKLCVFGLPCNCRFSLTFQEFCLAWWSKIALDSRTPPLSAVYEGHQLLGLHVDSAVLLVFFFFFF